MMAIRWRTYATLAVQRALNRPVSLAVMVALVLLMTLTLLYQKEPIHDPMTLSRKHTRRLEAILPDPSEAYPIEPDPTAMGHASFLVFVQSRASNHARRHQIRQSWGNASYYSQFSVKVIFSMGIDCRDPTSKMADVVIRQEAVRYQDVLLINMAEDYDSLTLKGLLTMKWINSRLPDVQYVVKTDDDVLLNMFAWHRIVQEIEVYNLSDCFMLGYVWINPMVFRRGRYVVSYEDFPFHKNPSFCSGAGYIMSRPALSAALEATDYLPLHIRDDPFFTGIIPQAMGIQLVSVDEHTFKIFGQIFDHTTKKPILALHDQYKRTWDMTWSEILKHGQRTGQQDAQEFNVRVVPEQEYGLRFSRLSQSLNHSLQYECHQRQSSQTLQFTVHV